MNSGHIEKRIDGMDSISIETIFRIDVATDTPLLSVSAPRYLEATDYFQAYEAYARDNPDQIVLSIIRLDELPKSWR